MKDAKSPASRKVASQQEERQKLVQLGSIPSGDGPVGRQRPPRGLISAARKFCCIWLLDLGIMFAACHSYVVCGLELVFDGPRFIPFWESTVLGIPKFLGEGTSLLG